MPAKPASPLLDFDEAVARALAMVAPLPTELLSVEAAPDQLRKRALAEALTSNVTQPPADVSAMDGYAVRAEDLPGTLKQVGESAAGHPLKRAIGPGECARIFTGAIVPEGADAIAIQEDCTAVGNQISSTIAVTPGRYVRAKGIDLRRSSTLPVGTPLSARTLALAAAMDHAQLPVHRRPRVAILSTGDEIKRPGEPRGPGDIVSSNHITLSTLVAAAGGLPTVLPIAPDNFDELTRRIERFSEFDLAIVSGGASVGDHDLVKPVLEALGAQIDFWRIAMRPGKPLMVAKLEQTPVLGLPGNPVSSYVCGLFFAVPMVQRLCGLPQRGLRRTTAILSSELKDNDRRREFMRAHVDEGGNVTPADSQDSSLLSRLGRANCLIDRPAFAPSATKGTSVQILLLDDW